MNAVIIMIFLLRYFSFDRSSVYTGYYQSGLVGALRDEQGNRPTVTNDES